VDRAQDARRAGRRKKDRPAPPETKAEILRYSSAGRVPILRDGDTVVWGSLAILEYLAEKRPQLWRATGAARKGAFSGRRSPRSSGKGPHA